MTLTLTSFLVKSNIKTLSLSLLKFFFSFFLSLFFILIDNIFILEISNGLDVVYAIDTSNNVDSNLLSHVKRYVSASLDYFTLPTTQEKEYEKELPTGSESLSQDGPIRAGIMSFDSIQPIIQLTLSKTHPLNTYREVINSLTLSDKNKGFDQPVDVIRMLNEAQQKMFSQAPTRPGTSETAQKKLLVVFMNPVTKQQLSSPEVARKINDINKIFGIQTAFVLVDDKGLDFSRLKKAVGSNFMVISRNGNSLPLLYPDFERVVASTIGKLCLLLLHYYLILHINHFSHCLIEASSIERD